MVPTPLVTTPLWEVISAKSEALLKRGCFSTGRGVFHMEGVCSKWRGCISTGGGAFQMEGVRFIWRGCISTGGGGVSYGGGMFQMAFQLEGGVHMEGVCLKWRGCDAC